ncbi:hypothetical protein RJ639_002714 [Escallonia herrerae]|uniref:Uncharacterized protein n=1 Tax=Escallonia herrerae TaxID=1293975 RepID=A0AA88W3C8_9ASTE|nr:hypothetical protein RJ639_002714 [Escallonia herrerae]
MKERSIEALVDVAATANFISLGAGRQLVLSIVADENMIQPVNSGSKCIHGMVEEADIEFEDWKGQATLTMVDTDDHDVVLGMDFMRHAHAIPMFQSNSVLLLGWRNTQNLFYLCIMSKPLRWKFLSSLRIR